MIWSVLGDRQGVLWIGTERRPPPARSADTPVHPLPPRSRKTATACPSTRSPGCAKTHPVRCGSARTAGDSTGSILPQDGSFTIVTTRSDPHSLDSDLVLSVFIDRKGVVWVGTQIGALNRFDRASGRFKAYRTPGCELRLLDIRGPSGNPLAWGLRRSHLVRPSARSSSRSMRTTRGIPAASATTKCGPCMRIGRAGCGSAPSGGLNELDRTRGTFTSITRKDGLAGNSVRAILEDGEGYLWLATDGGLSRFHPTTRTFRNFTESDGLPGNLLNPYGLQGTWQSPTGEMVLGSTNGLTTFFPDRLSPNPYVPPVVLTELELFNKPVGPGKDSPLQQAHLGNGFPDAHSRTEYLHAGIRRLELCRPGEEPVSLSAGGSGIRMERGG